MGGPGGPGGWGGPGGPGRPWGRPQGGQWGGARRVPGSTGGQWWGRPSAVAWLIIGIAVIVVLVRTNTIHLNKFTVIYFAVLIPSIILHEVSHGAVANALGDDTAKRAGRLTLNPLAHVDLFGTIILPAILVLTSSVAFGWAKPVPVNISRLRNPRNGSVLVSLAGPATNAVLFVLVALVFRFSVGHGFLLGPNTGGIPLYYEVLYLAGIANIWVCIFNLLPIPPLDGSALVERLLPASALPSYYRMRSFGMIIVMLVALTAFQSPSISSHVANVANHIWTSVAGSS